MNRVTTIVARLTHITAIVNFPQKTAENCCLQTSPASRIFQLSSLGYLESLVTF